MFRLDGKWWFPGERWRVEMVGCCSFSNSRSFAACFLQIMLHKQAWLTWYLRKWGNSRAHGSLRRVRTLSCVMVLPAFLFWFCFSARVGSSICRSGKYSSRFHGGALCMSNSVFVTIANVVMLWLQRSERWCHPVQWCLCLVVLNISYVFRFILVFSCLVLSVFSTIPPHQDFSSYCLLILVRHNIIMMALICPRKRLKNPRWNHFWHFWLIISMLSRICNLSPFAFELRIHSSVCWRPKYGGCVLSVQRGFAR